MVAEPSDGGQSDNQLPGACTVQPPGSPAFSRAVRHCPRPASSPSWTKVLPPAELRRRRVDVAPVALDRRLVPGIMNPLFPRSGAGREAASGRLLLFSSERQLRG